MGFDEVKTDGRSVPLSSLFSLAIKAALPGERICITPPKGAPIPRLPGASGVALNGAGLYCWQ